MISLGCCALCSALPVTAREVHAVPVAAQKLMPPGHAPPAPTIPAPAPVTPAPAPVAPPPTELAPETERKSYESRVAGKKQALSRGVSDYHVDVEKLSLVPRTKAADFLKLAPGI